MILEEGAEAAKQGIAICFGCRNNSQAFARQAACVMAIVSHETGIPLDELVFKSIKAV